MVRLLLLKSTVTDDFSPTSYMRNELEEPLLFAVRDNRKDVVGAFVEADTDINGPVLANQTPLHVPGCDDLEEMVDLLFELGANLQAPDHHGEPPLHTAIQNGHLVTVVALLDRGASVDTRDNLGSTPLGGDCLSRLH